MFSNLAGSSWQSAEELGAKTYVGARHVKADLGYSLRSHVAHIIATRLPQPVKSAASSLGACFLRPSTFISPVFSHVADSARQSAVLTVVMYYKLPHRRDAVTSANILVSCGRASPEV